MPPFYYLKKFSTKQQETKERGKRRKQG